MKNNNTSSALNDKYEFIEKKANYSGGYGKIFWIRDKKSKNSICFKERNLKNMILKNQKLKEQIKMLLKMKKIF